MNPFEDDRFKEIEEAYKKNPSGVNPFDLFSAETPVTIYKSSGRSMNPRERIDARHAAILYLLRHGFFNHVICKELDVSAGLVSSVRAAHLIAQGTQNKPSTGDKPVEDKPKAKVFAPRISTEEAEQEFLVKVKELFKERISCDKASELLGCSREKVRKICRKYGIEKKYHLGPAVAAEIRLAYQNGEMTQAELAQEYKVSVSTIYNLLAGKNYTE